MEKGKGIAAAAKDEDADVGAAPPDLQQFVALYLAGGTPTGKGRQFMRNTDKVGMWRTTSSVFDETMQAFFVKSTFP